MVAQERQLHEGAFRERSLPAVESHYQAMHGKKQVVDLKIDPDALDPEDVDTLQDMIVAAINEGIRQIDEMQENEYGKLTGGLGIPGM